MNTQESQPVIEENKELQKSPESEDKTAHVTPSEKKCTYCYAPMAVHARVCASCNRDQRWYLNYFRIGDLLLLLSILISFGMVYFSYRNFHESREERVKASEALQRASKAEDLVKQGEQQLKQLQVASIEGRKEADKIISLVREAQSKLAKVEDTAKEARQKTDLLQYQDIALYNAEGNKSGSVAGVRIVGTPINDWNERFVTRREGKIDFNCSPEAIGACKAVIEKLPLYPFSYYFLAKCLREHKDPLWREYALKARRC